MTTTAKRALALTLMLAVLTPPSCDVCGLIDQRIFVAVDDPELGGLIADCRDGVQPATEPTCVGPRDSSGQFSCACLLLCRRVFEIVYADPHRPGLERCAVGFDDQARAEVTIEYRSACQ